MVIGRWWVFVVWLLLSLFFVIILLLCAFIKITINITLQNMEKKDILRIHVRLLGFISFTYTLPKANTHHHSLRQNSHDEFEQSCSDESNDEHIMTTMNRMMNHISNGYLISKKFLAHVAIHKLNWESTIGTGDAATTGTITGLVWTLKGSVATLFNAHMQIQKRPHFTVVPSFQTALFQTRFECIFSFRLGHAIGAGIKALKYIRKVKKQSSNETKLLDSTRL